MKKLLFAAYSLDIGGIEKALVTLTNYLCEKGYEITIVLEKKQGIFLKEINPKINIIEYNPSNTKNVLKRKAINLLKRIKFIVKYKNKFDFSASFATYSLVSSFVSRVASKNNCLWVHTNYLTYYKGDVKKFKDFFKSINYDKFKYILFVSKNAKDDYISKFPDDESKSSVLNNLINYKEINKKAMEKVNYNKEENTTVFLNIGRHEENSKRITRLIDASEKLKKDGFKFKVLFVGDGPDNIQYRKMVKIKKLEDYIDFLGMKENPYPYFNVSDCVILTSDYEGYPVVFLESRVLNKPIITTKVSDYKEIEGKYGIITEKNTEDIYKAMKFFINEGYIIKEKFNSKKYNDEIINKLEIIF